MLLCWCARLDNILKTTSFEKMLSWNKSDSKSHNQINLSCMLPGTQGLLYGLFTEERKLLVKWKLLNKF